MGLNKQIPHFDWVQNVLPADRIAYIGLRDVDEGERGILKELNIRAYSMHEVHWSPLAYMRHYMVYHYMVYRHTRSVVLPILDRVM